MARPAIVIGLGGTGQWVLTYLKKDLMETNQGKMPENVKLLSFDTMPEASVATKTVQDHGDSSHKDVNVGAIRLDPRREFFGLTGNGYDLGEQVVKGQAPHIGRWFDAEFYRQQQMPSLWDLASGAGQVRQFGRLGFFMKLDDIIHNSIRQAFLSVKPLVKKGNELEVIIVASFAGGTGAGMFVDTGIICRRLADLVNNNLIIRGFFVLPRAFTQGGQIGLMDNHMLARSFAAWRELDRFMNIGPDYGAPRVTYRPADQNLDMQLSIRPFDQCYLVDSRRQSHSLENTKPEFGVHPSIADFIGTVIDEESGVVYTQDAVNNAGVTQAQNHTIGYSALGTYSIKVPIYYAMQEYSLNFSKDLMTLWLVPEQDSNGNIYRLAINQNREEGIGKKQGRDAAIDLLQNPTGIQRRSRGTAQVGNAAIPGQAVETILNSMFLPRLAQIYAEHKLDDGHNIEVDAQGGHTLLVEGEVDPNTYAGVFCSMPSDAQNTRIIYENREEMIDPVAIKTELNSNIWAAVPTSKEMNESPIEGPDRLERDIPKYEQTHFGAGGGRGDYGTMLDRSRLFQVVRFRAMLQQQTMNILNGTKGSVVDQRSGKLGFVIDMYEELVKIFDYFIQYIDKVIERRGSMQLLNGAQQVRDVCKASMLEAADKKCIFFFDHPKAHITQRQYLQAVEDNHNIVKDDMLLASMSQAAREMRNEAKIALENARRWARALVLGSDNTIGAYRTMQRDLDGTRSTRLEDEKAGETQLLLQMKEYQKVKLQQEIDANLERFTWDVNTQDGFNISCTVRVPQQRIDDDGNVTYQDVDRNLSLDDTDFAQAQNVGLISSIGRYVYREEPSKHRAIEEVMRMTDPNYGDASTFAKDLIEHSEVLVDLTQGVAQTSIVKWMYLRLKSEGINPGVSAYAAQVQQWLKEHTAGILTDPNKLRIVSSENEHAITMIQLWDNIQQSDFNIWSTLRDAYIRHVNSGTGYENAARLHIFPAECNASKYESRLPQLLRAQNKGYRIFHPRVVMLLEDLERVRLFFRCYAYGFIKKHETEIGERYYYLDVPARGTYIEQKLWLTSPKDKDGNIRTDWPSVFEVMNAFVNVGRDVNNMQNNIAWKDLRNTLILLERELRNRGELESTIQAAIQNGLVKQLRDRYMDMQRDARRMDQAAGVPMRGWGSGQEYEDLADLAEMMFMEVIRDQTPDLVN